MKAKILITFCPRLKINIAKKHPCCWVWLPSVKIDISYEPPSISLLPTTPPTTHSSTYSTTPPTPCPPILLVSLDMLPSPLPTHFSAPLHFGHSYIYGVIRCSSPSKASRITAHTELWRAEGVWGVEGVGRGGRGGGGQSKEGEERGIFKWGMKRQMEPAVEWFPKKKNERKMIREKNQDCFWPIQEHFICPME